MKKVLFVLTGIVLFAAAMFLLVMVGWLIAAEVWPALQQGSLNIESNSRVLNILWEGNELYILLAAYTLLAGGMAYTAARTIRAACQKPEP